MQRGPDQTVKVVGVSESERGKRPQPRTTGPVRPLNNGDQAPIRVQGWWENELQFIAPIRIIDGVVDDLRWRATKVTRIDRLVFIYGGRGYVYPVGRIDVAKGQVLRLALSHMKLIDRFGANVLG